LTAATTVQIVSNMQPVHRIRIWVAPRYRTPFVPDPVALLLAEQYLYLSEKSEGEGYHWEASTFRLRRWVNYWLKRFVSWPACRDTMLAEDAAFISLLEHDPRFVCDGDPEFGGTWRLTREARERIHG